MAQLPLNTVEYGHQSVDDECQLQLIADITEALRLSRLSDKLAAITMGVDKGQFSRFLSNQGGVDARRLARLSDDFWRELIRVRAARFSMQIREPSKRAEALADVLMATAMALRDSDFTERLPARADAMVTATLDQPAAEQKRRRA